MLHKNYGRCECGGDLDIYDEGIEKEYDKNGYFKAKIEAAKHVSTWVVKLKRRDFYKTCCN